MNKRVLIPLDGSAFAEQVLPQLTRFLSPDKTQLALLGVIDPRTYTNTVYEYTPVPALKDRKEEYISYLETIRIQLQNQGYRVYCTLVTGDPAEQILNAAEQDQVDLIAMTTHGRSGIRRWALGSVAERVIHHATLPIFLVRDEVYQEKGVVQRILVPLDGSALAEEALPQATMVAQATGAEIWLFHVIALSDVENLLADKASEQTHQHQEQRISQLAETYLHKVIERLQTAGVRSTGRLVLGDVATKISDIVDKEEIDLVVMSTHGRSGLSRWVYGSVANQVLRSVNCPLLIVRNREGAGAGQSIRPVTVQTTSAQMARQRRSRPVRPTKKQTQ